MSWTERYVRSDAAGSGDGTTNTNSGANGAWTLAEGITNEAAGMRINVLAGTYANTSTSRAFAAAGTTTAGIWWRGFKTSIGDQDTNRAAVAGTDIPLFTFTTGQMQVSGAFHIFSNLAVTSACTTAGGAVFCTASQPKFYGVRVENTAANTAAQAISGDTGPIGAAIVGCWFKATSTCTYMVSFNSISTIMGCYFIGGSNGANPNGGGNLSLCVFDGQAADAIVPGSTQLTILNCSVYGPGGNGVNLNSIPTRGHIIANCHFENCSTAGKAGINNTTGTNSLAVTIINNSFYNCTSNILNITETFSIFDKGTLAGSGFTAGGSHDLTATTALKAIGYPGTLENVALTGYLDVGALQRQEPAGGGSTVIAPFGGGTLLTM